LSRGAASRYAGKSEVRSGIWNLRFENYLMIVIWLLVILFGDRLTVGQQVLDLFIGVRVPVPEHCL
jgi:hypothetical protein